LKTPSQTVGPFYSIGLARRSENELVESAAPGALRIVGQLIDGDDTPIPDGMVEIWQAADRRWGRSGTDDEGRFSFVAPKSTALPGEAPRLDVYIFARGLLKHQLTRMYFPDEAEANAADPVLSSLTKRERETLVAEADGSTLRFDIHMQGEHATVFFAV
jgi:protocatechuate 3,4-dioxygenase, alpha subunit